jgi:hypothetical protein
MSRNSKGYRLNQAAREIGTTRKSGGKGPGSTVAKHGKRRESRAAHNVWPRPIVRTPLRGDRGDRGAGARQSAYVAE